MTTELHLASLSNPTLIPKGRIGRFVYEREIGKGSVGIVYLFRDPLIGRKVAIKVLNPQLQANQRQLFENQFIQEARAAGRLNHPNIVTVYDADKTGDLLFIVMEYLEGKELLEMLNEGHQFSYKQIADMVARIANALDYAHENGVIHRDIKPANIFISGTSTPKVLDFGIASASRQLADLDATLGHDPLSERRLLGTPNYMSPEQTKSEELDARTDIFSLGVVLYQLLCGQMPFKANDVPGLLHAIAHDAAIPPHEIRADVPLRLARIAAKALAKKPSERYQRAADMARDLNRFLEKERTERIIAKIQNPDQSKADLTQLATPNKPGNAPKMSALAQRKAMQMLGLGLALILIVWLFVIVSSQKPPIAPDAQKTVVASPALASPESQPTSVLPNPVPAEEATSLKANEHEETPVIVAKHVSKPKPAPILAKVEAPVLKTGSVSIAVSPWGEVFIDGQSKGVAPPLNRVSLSVGNHRIEIKNGDDSYAVNIDVNSEKEAKVGHRF
jgi:eukaryotic-like serine/threonine-protein kinase